jgi:mannose-6-phosphate isomerase-like protein (cupin superfamily)
MRGIPVILSTLGLVTALGPLALAQEPTPDVYTPSDLSVMEQKLELKAVKGLATETIKKYSSDYTILAFRSQSGQAELHDKFADFYMVIAGEATLISGGKIVNGAATAPGEMRGDSIQDGKETTIKKGDIVHIPANIPHQITLAKGATIQYFVIKVQEVE